MTEPLVTTPATTEPVSVDPVAGNQPCTFDLITARVRATLAGLTSREILLANQGGPQPAEPYATLLLVSAPQLGRASVKWNALPDPSTDLIERLSQDREASFSLQFFGGDANSDLEQTLLQLRGSDVRNELNALDLGFLRYSGPDDIASVVGNSMESRAQSDVFFHVETSFETTIDSIGTVEIDQTLNTPDGTESDNRTIDVP